MLGTGGFLSRIHNWALLAWCSAVYTRVINRFIILKTQHTSSFLSSINFTSSAPVDSHFGMISFLQCKLVHFFFHDRFDRWYLRFNQIGPNKAKNFCQITFSSRKCGPCSVFRKNSWLITITTAFRLRTLD